MDAVCEVIKEQPRPAVWPGSGFCARPGWFGPGERARFGWLYLPDQINGATGVVIVPPFGGEDVCGHRTLKHLAEASASDGFISVRFDLDGCGDSVGDDGEPRRLECWITSVMDACDLARHAGARRLVLVGLRLGAALATLAAQRRDDVAALVTFNAVTRGKNWLRELRAFQAAMNLQPSPDGMDEEGAGEDGMEAAGFLLNPETCQALRDLDLTRSGAPPAPQALILDRDDLPGCDRWANHLQALGCRIERRCVPGYVEMMADAHRNEVAQTFIDTCMDYLHDLRVSTGYAATLPAPSLRPSTALRVGDEWIEETVVSPGDGIFGILACRRGGATDRALLIANAGAVRHIGVDRFDVVLARQMAAAGLQVLRMDLTGIGDSPARAGRCENLAFGTDGAGDVGVCAAWLRTRGARELIVGGMCSGASHALHAILAGLPVDAAYLVNCSLFEPIVDTHHARDRRFHDIAHYNKAMKSARSWRKLLSGRVNLHRIAKVAAWKVVLQGKGLLLDAARRVGLPVRGDLSNQFAAVARRGVRLHFLFSDHDPGLVHLAVEAGSSLTKYCRDGPFSLRTFADTNHTFTQRWAQASLLLAVREILTPESVAARAVGSRQAQPSARAH